MADFNGTILTEKGRNLLAKALTGTELQFTKVQLGDGIWDENINPEQLTALVSPKLDLPIQELKKVGDGTARLRFVLTNTGLSEGFFIREIGIFANDPDEGEILYSVTYAGNADFIPADGVTKIEDVTDIYTVVSNAQNVTAVISDTVVLATKEDVDSAVAQHNEDTQAHQDIRTSIENLDATKANADLSNITSLGNILNLDGTGSRLDADLVRGLPADFSANLGSAGYQKLPSGLIIQWGKVDWQNTNSNEKSVITVDIALPVAFPNTCLCAVATNAFPDDGLESTEHTLAVSIVNNSTIRVRLERVEGTNNGNEQGHTYYFAIGY